ncbi:hypothetical protein ACWEQ4_01035 [Rhodococcus sp. NPDC003994]
MMTDEEFIDHVQTLGEWELGRLQEVRRYLPATQIVAVDARAAHLREQRMEAARAAHEERERKRLAAEAARAEAQAEWEKDPLNAATAAGWNAMRKSAPNLDGVTDFNQLAPALVYRYASFARAVLAHDITIERIEQPLPEVKSETQKLREQSAADPYRTSEAGAW